MTLWCDLVKKEMQAVPDSPMQRGSNRNRTNQAFIVDLCFGDAVSLLPNCLLESELLHFYSVFVDTQTWRVSNTPIHSVQSVNRGYCVNCRDKLLVETNSDEICVFSMDVVRFFFLTISQLGNSNVFNLYILIL